MIEDNESDIYSRAWKQVRMDHRGRIDILNLPRETPPPNTIAEAWDYWKQSSKKASK